MAATLPPTPSPQIYQGSGRVPALSKVRLVHVPTGEVFEAWPVDAREHLAAGDCVLEGQPLPAAVPEAPTEPVEQDDSTTDTGSETTTAPATDADPAPVARRPRR